MNTSPDDDDVGRSEAATSAGSPRSGFRCQRDCQNGAPPLVSNYTKQLVKRFTAAVCFRSGCMEALARQRLDQSAAVLMYHRVLRPGQIALSFSHPGIIVALESFEAQMAFLKKRFRLLSIDEFEFYYRGQKRLPPRSCLITFDDGWIDNFENAAPVLEKHAIPSLIFLSVDFIGTKKRFWQERFRSALTALHPNKARYEGAIEAMDLEAAFKNRFVQIRHYSEDLFHEALSNSISDLKSQPVGRIEDNIETLEMAMNPNEKRKLGDSDFINWQMVSEMCSKDVFDFGSHGCSHQLMTSPDTDLRRETAESKKTIEDRLGSTITSFSYPNGSYNQDCIQAVRASGYRLAFSTNFGLADTSTSPFEINRINIHQSACNTLPLFYGRLLNLW